MSRWIDCALKVIVPLNWEWPILALIIIFFCFGKLLKAAIQIASCIERYTIRNHHTNSCFPFLFLVLFYLNSTTCEILFSLSLFASFPFVCDQCKTITRWWILAIATATRDDVDANNFFSSHFYSSISSCVLRYMYVCAIDHSLDFVSSHRHSRSLAVSKQTYPNNKSSIIFYWSDWEIEGKELYRCMM